MIPYDAPVGRIHRLIATAALATGCTHLVTAPTPMRAKYDRVDPAKRARCLLLMLPGIGDDDTDFADRGFLADLRERNLSVDTIRANATLGYYARRTVGDRLEADLLGPNRAGYEQVWVLGLSMGGLGSIVLAERPGIALTGMILMAPFLGKDIVSEIRAKGGLAAWDGKSKARDFEHDIWVWLKAATAPAASAPPIYLLTGDQDKFAAAHRLLADALPAERRFRRYGGHDWAPWRLLWNDFLDRSDFAARCGPR